MHISKWLQRRRFTAGCLAALGLTLVPACSENSRDTASKTGSSLERARQAKTIRIGFANEAPYAYLDVAINTLTGEAPEIARIILAELGIPAVEGVPAEFGSLIPGIKAGRFDVIASGMYILPPRCREIAFSNPTYSVGESFVVRKGNPMGLHSYADMALRNDAKLAVVAGAVQQQYARVAGVPEARVVVFPEAPSAIEGVSTQRVDAFAATSLTINHLLKLEKSGRVERADPFNDPLVEGKPVRGYGAFGFRKEDTDLVSAFNEGLARLIGSQRHQDLVRKFGFTDRELPGTASVENLCRG
jgi:polar amino acid transport system substrate-binding protein